MINKSKLNKKKFLFLWDFKDNQVKNKRMFKDGVNSFITCMFIVMLEKKPQLRLFDLQPWLCDDLHVSINYQA